MTSATSDSTAATTSLVGVPLLAHDAQQPVTGLGQRREALEGLERRRQPAPVALVVAAAPAASCWAAAMARGCGVIGGRVDSLRRHCPCLPTYRQLRGLRVEPTRVKCRSRCARASALSPQDRQRLEDPGRDGRARERHAQRLEDVLRLAAARLDDAAQSRARCSSTLATARRGQRFARAPAAGRGALARRATSRAPSGRRRARRR